MFLDKLAQQEEKQWALQKSRNSLQEGRHKRGLLRAQNPTKSNPSPITWKARREGQYLSMRDWNIKAVINHQAGLYHGWQADLKWPLDLEFHGQGDNKNKTLQGSVSVPD